MRAVGPQKKASFAEKVLAGVLGVTGGAAVFFISYELGARSPLRWEYGLGLFAVISFCSGFAASYALEFRGLRTFWDCFVGSVWSLTLATLALCFFAVEGLICIALSLPITIPSLIAGIALARYFRRRGTNPTRLTLSLLPAAVVTIVSEHWIVSPTTSHTLVTEMTIDASQEVIWPLVLNLEAYPPPREPLFNAGIAHPISTWTEARLGGSRYCVLSTGVMKEVVEEFDPPPSLPQVSPVRDTSGEAFGTHEVLGSIDHAKELVSTLNSGGRLTFRVLNTPEPMRELNPFGQPHPPHLRGYFTSRRGRIELIPLSVGRTLIRGTSWYDQSIGPDWYWSLWTDKIVHDIHRRVFSEIARRARG
jgi:hypothetical protein